MPALIPTDHAATITWLGRVPHRDASEIETIAIPEMPLTFAGLAGEFHAGEIRPSCSRVTAQHPKGTPIRNVRQISIVSAEELARIAQSIGLDALDPAWLGASVVIPCHFPSMTIESARPGHGKAFRAAARGLRGVTAWVEREGVFRIGDRLRLHVPDQRAWRPN